MRNEHVGSPLSCSALACWASEHHRLPTTVFERNRETAPPFSLSTQQVAEKMRTVKGFSIAWEKKNGVHIYIQRADDIYEI